MPISRETRMNGLDPSIAAGLFSSSVIREMARTGRSKVFSSIARESGVDEAFEPDASVRSVFDAVFELLSKHYRNEHIYKTAITRKILLGRHSLNTAVMMTEFRVATNKADVVILNGTATAYEIKSDLDNLDRLSAQVESYLKVFARVCVVTADFHSDAVSELVPLETGILRLTSRGCISTVREPIENPGRIDPESAFEVMQIHEAKKVLRTLGIDVPEVPNTRMYKILRAMFSELDPSQVHSAMVKVLRNTRRQSELSGFLDSFPTSLQALVLATQIKHREQAKLIDALNSPLVDALKWS